MKYSEYIKCFAEQKSSPTIIEVVVKKNPDPKGFNKVIGTSGPGQGRREIWGNLTEHQRDVIFIHLENYIELLVKEAEKELEFRDKWDEHI